jgi:hypothetical protein
MPESDLKYQKLIIMLLLGCAAVFVARIQPSYAQGGRGGTINGTVTDNTGAVIPGAKITITNVATRQTRDVVTADDGGYTALFLPLGQYSITVTHPGCKSLTQTGITLTSDEVATVNISIDVGELKQTIEVSTGGQMVETATATLPLPRGLPKRGHLPITRTRKSQLLACNTDRNEAGRRKSK